MPLKFVMAKANGSNGGEAYGVAKRTHVTRDLYNQGRKQRDIARTFMPCLELKSFEASAQLG